MTDTAETALQLRNGLRRLAKAVVVITCKHQGSRYAMAATAVSELSLDPPSLLICVNRSASLFAPLAEGGHFCVNILRSDQHEISAACSGKAKGEARFDLGDWAEAKYGLPVLRDAQASFLCRNDRAFDYGTHRVVIGRVEEVLTAGPVDPLVYADGRYLQLGRAIP